jgi:hypothetical protein
MVTRNSRSLALESESGDRTSQSRLGALGRRFARAVIGVDQEEPAGATELAHWLRDERGAVGEAVLARFPIARRGYDCVAVDELLWELEEELAGLRQEAVELRARTTSDEVADEIKRIGEQTSVVLIAAHEQREEILRAARAEAERCSAEARSKARAVTAEAEARARELEAQTEAIGQERQRLIDDVRLVSSALAAVADSAHERIPPSPLGATAGPDADESSLS